MNVVGFPEATENATSHQRKALDSCGTSMSMEFRSFGNPAAIPASSGRKRVIEQWRMKAGKRVRISPKFLFRRAIFRKSLLGLGIEIGNCWSEARTAHGLKSKLLASDVVQVSSNVAASSS